MKYTFTPVEWRIGADRAQDSRPRLSQESSLTQVFRVESKGSFWSQSPSPELQSAIDKAPADLQALFREVMKQHA